MKVTKFTKDAIAYRRQQKRLLADGWDHVEDPVWEIDRGGRCDEVIVAVEIATDGKSLYVKTAKRATQAA